MLHLRSVSVHMRVLVQELASLKSVAVCRSLPFLARSIPIFVSDCLSVETACSVTSSILCSFSADIEHFSKFEINIPKSDHLKHFFIISYVRLKFKLPVCNVRLRERALHSTVPNLIAKKQVKPLNRISHTSWPSLQASLRFQISRVILLFHMFSSKSVFAIEKIMSQYTDDVDMDAGTADHPGNKKLSQEADVESVGSGFSDAFSLFG